MIKLTFKQLWAIRELAATQSFTIAAARLHTAQSNLSKTIQQAETALGVKLFERTTKSVVLTDIGRNFAQSVLKMMDELQAEIDNVSALGHVVKGSIGIGVTPLLAGTLLPPLFAAYAERFPEVALRIEDNSTNILFAKLLSREIDLAIGTFEASFSEIALESLFDDPLIVLSHPSLGLDKEISWDELSGHRIVALTWNSTVGRIIENTHWDVMRKRLRIVAQANHWQTVVSLASTLKAVCITPTYTLALPQAQALVKSKLVGPEVGRTVQVAYLKGREPSAATRGFLEILRASFTKKKTKAKSKR